MNEEQYRRELNFKELDTLSSKELDKILEIKKDVLNELKKKRLQKVRDILAMQGMIKDETK